PLERAGAANVFGPRREEAALVDARVRNLIDEEEAPAGLCDAVAFDLKRAEQAAPPSIEPERMWFDHARTAVVIERQQVLRADRLGDRGRRSQSAHVPDASAGLSQPFFGAKRLPYLPASASSRDLIFAAPSARMCCTGPPRNGAKPVPKMTPASSRSASSTTPSCRQATDSLSIGRIMRS